MSSGRDFPRMRENGTCRKAPPLSSAEGARCCCLRCRWIRCEELSGVPGADRCCRGGCKLHTRGDGRCNQSKSTSTESRDRCPRCLGLALASTEAESTMIVEMRMRERAPSKKEMKGEEFSQGCNISALTARLGDAWRPFTSHIYKIAQSPYDLETAPTFTN